MADNNNIFNDEYRKNFLRIADYKSLNDYLKNMDKLSKKGGKYLDMYSKDIDYLLTLNDTQYQDGGNIMNLFMRGNNKSTSSEKQQMTEVCNTEAYVNKITNITQNSYCPIVTQKTNKCDNTCVNRFSELQSISQVLSDDITCKKQSSDWIKAIRKFIDILICCGSTFSQDQYEPLRTIYFKNLSKLITNNPKFLKEAFTYLNKILQNEDNILSEDFMKQYSELRNKKHTMTQAQYITAKEKLIGDNIIKLGPSGFQTVYTSKFVEKVIYAYKKLMSTN